MTRTISVNAKSSEKSIKKMSVDVKIEMQGLTASEREQEIDRLKNRLHNLLMCSYFNVSEISFKK